MKNENTTENNVAAAVTFYFLSPSGAQLHSRNYPMGKVPLGALWCSVNGEGELCYRTSSSKSLMRSDKKALSQPGGYSSIDGVCVLLCETPALTASDPAVLAFIAAHKPIIEMVPPQAGNQLEARHEALDMENAKEENAPKAEKKANKKNRK